MQKYILVFFFQVIMLNVFASRKLSLRARKVNLQRSRKLNHNCFKLIFSAPFGLSYPLFRTFGQPFNVLSQLFLFLVNHLALF